MHQLDQKQHQTLIKTSLTTTQLSHEFSGRSDNHQFKFLIFILIKFGISEYTYGCATVGILTVTVSMPAGNLKSAVAMLSTTSTWPILVITLPICGCKPGLRVPGRICTPWKPGTSDHVMLKRSAAPHGICTWNAPGMNP